MQILKIIEVMACATKNVKDVNILRPCSCTHLQVSFVKLIHIRSYMSWL